MCTDAVTRRQGDVQDEFWWEDLLVMPDLSGFYNEAGEMDPKVSREDKEAYLQELRELDRELDVLLRIDVERLSLLSSLARRRYRLNSIPPFLQQKLDLALRLYV